ncbi:hypothetical protein DDE18_04875 [Nocardioides gansuensis]|uniref:DUF1097 domain-containing protein n=1 Tax=Nocardioides gansuensis TaxID=2138300 RepID=A0A2T8FD77_9ACTN|nr:hypothetical protein [Nocardioides gansuensis]PVG83662.1 hypothetical protein DDE18_04875 [Nocardioides gansuensis]
MRTLVTAGAMVALAIVMLILVGAALDLNVDSAALTGAALGAVIALVPDRSTTARLGGFVVGLAAAWIGYVGRAGVLPDTSTGRALTAGLVVLIAVGVCAATWGRLPLWSALVGVAAMTGTYESAYSAAPSLVVDTSVTGATTALFTAAVGFLAAAAFSAGPAGSSTERRREAAPDDTHTELETMLEETR